MFTLFSDEDAPTALLLAAAAFVQVLAVSVFA